MSNEPDYVNNGALATIIVIVAIATLGVALVVTSLVREETAALHAQKDGTQENEFRDLRAAQLAEITAAPTWRDREKGLVSVPIDRAMEIVAEAVRENPFNLSPGSPKPEEEEELTEEGSTAESESAEGDEAQAGAEAGTPDEAAPSDAPGTPSAPVAPTEKKAPATPSAPAAPAEKKSPTQPGPAPTKPAPTKPAPPPQPAPAPAPAP